MTLEANLAAISLVVSLTALLVASGQLFQALIATAEGYRRCAPSVIGVWAKLRRRRWNLTEFRFEVEYATPHFSVYSDATLHTVHQIYGPTYDLVSLQDRHCRHHDRNARVLKATLNLEEDGGKRHKQFVPRDEVRVTWLKLMEELHKNYRAHEPERSSPSPGDNRVAISIRRWNWDFMPADLLRPLATSTLNTVILFGLRLNMKWRVLDQKIGTFQADGNGYALTSTLLHGLGTTFTFSILGNQGNGSQCAPSETADRMRFGIVPGCRSLVKRDFYLVNSSRELSFQTLFEAIGVEDQELSEELANDFHVEQRNDATILLSTFLHNQVSSHLYNYFPGWNYPPTKTQHELLSAFHWFEGRMGYVDALAERLHTSMTHKARSHLETVLEIFEELRKEWSHDFYCIYEKSAIEGTDEGRKRALAKVCGDIFAWTTAYFQGQHKIRERSGYNEKSGLDWSEHHDGRSAYVHLVAGHSITLLHAIRPVWENLSKYTNPYPGGEDRRQRHGPEFSWYQGSPGLHHQYIFSQECAAHVRHEDFGVVRHLRSKSIDWHEDYIEAAWWVLVLRGIVWDMSTTGHMLQRQRSYHWSTDYVPSAFYDTRTPVWIT